MRLHRVTTAAAFLGAALFLPGCFDSETSPSTSDETTTDEQAIQYVVFDEQSDLADPNVLVFDEDSDASAAPIETNAWRRELLHLDRTIQITINQTEGEPATADVKAQFDASGILHLFVRSGDDRVEYTKDFADQGVRSALLTRERPIRGPRNCGWRLVALSGVLVKSPETTRNIEWVRVQAGDVDETITNVTDLVRLESLLALPAATEATVTVKTGDMSDQAYLHLRGRHQRIQMQSNGDATFTARFVTSAQHGPRHFAVDVLSEGTLYDDVAPYDNIAWGIPYRVGEMSPVS
jgi:hypothetical protein